MLEETLKYFHRAISDGHFDEVEEQKYTGAKRLIDTTDSLVADGTLSKEQQQELILEWTERQSHPQCGEE